MRLTVNGVPIPGPEAGLIVEADCAGGATLGPVEIHVRGGTLTVCPGPDGQYIQLWGEEGRPPLVLQAPKPEED